MNNKPFDHCEAAIWNFLLFWCLGDSGASLEALTHWLSDQWGEADIYIALAGLMSRGAINYDQKGYYPIVSGKAYRNMGREWGDLIALAVDPERTLH